MAQTFKRAFAILRCISIGTHVWCISVLAGAVLLCISFFNESSQRDFRVVNVGKEEESIARQKVIEYGSVIGSLPGVGFDDAYEEMIEDTEDVPVVEISIPAIDYSRLADLNLDELDIDYWESEKPSMVATADTDIDLESKFSIEEVDALERLVQCEASTEDLDGRILVADVVLNRVDTGIWGDDILSVIEAPGQFRPVTNGAYKVTEVDSETKKAVISALLNEDSAMGALYFQKSAAKEWGDKQFLFRHGSHSFYK